MAEPDHLDRIAAQWRRERPDLDVEPLAILGRLLRVAQLADRALAAQLSAFDLQPGWFDLLAALRRSGEPYELNPTELMSATMLTSGGVTKRLDRLADAGLVERRPDPNDRRGTLVRLTRRGRTVIDKAVEAHVANEARLLGALKPAERRALDALLRSLLAGLAAAVILVASACGSAGSTTSTNPKPLSSLGHLQPAPNPGAPSGELVPIPAAPVLAPAASKATYTKSVDGIKCQQNERLISHEHAHLTLFVNGEQRRVPAGVGIWPPVNAHNYINGQFGITEGNCLSWLNTRYADGLIHIETPVKRSFVLGEFFDVWGQPLSATQVGPEHGAVTAIVNGRVWAGDPRQIPLKRHAQIQLEVGKPLIAPESITFPGRY